MLLKRLLNAGAMPASSPAYWRLLRYMLYVFGIAAVGVAGLFLSLAVKRYFGAIVSWVIGVGGIGCGWVLMFAPSVHVLWRRHRPCTALAPVMARSTSHESCFEN